MSTSIPRNIPRNIVMTGIPIARIENVFLSFECSFSCGAHLPLLIGAAI